MLVANACSGQISIFQFRFFFCIKKDDHNKWYEKRKRKQKIDFFSNVLLLCCNTKSLTYNFVLGCMHVLRKVVQNYLRHVCLHLILKGKRSKHGYVIHFHEIFTAWWQKRVNICECRK